MPDTSTVTTATAAETRAAGSKILGFILGGGSAIVDKLFDVANFITRDNSGIFYCPGAAGAAVINYSNSAGNFNAGIPAGVNEWRITENQFGNIAMIINGSANMGLGVSPTSRLHVKSNSDIARFETITARGFGQCYISLADPTGRKGYFGYTGNDGLHVINEMNNGILIQTNGFGVVLEANGDLRPTTDNGQDCGSASFRWNEIRAANGAIVTSDEREKTWRGGMSPTEITAAKRIAAELGFFQWNNSITDKGAHAARLHFGVRAQKVWAIMADEELIPPLIDGVTPDSKYAFLCWDQWDDVDPVPAVEEVRDEDDNVIVEARAAQPGRDVGDRFGVRTDQLALFLIAAQEARLAALESA